MHRLSFVIFVALLVLFSHGSAADAQESPRNVNDLQPVLQASTSGSRSLRDHLSLESDESIAISSAHRPSSANEAETLNKLSAFQTDSSTEKLEELTALNRAALPQSSKNLPIFTTDAHSSEVRLAPLSTSTRKAAQGAIMYTIPSNETDASFASALCAAIGDSSITILRVDGAHAPPGVYFEVPECIATSNLSQITVNKLRIPRADVFPASLTLFTCDDCLFDPVIGESSIGFDANGNIRWTDWWLRNPSIAYLSITSSNLAGFLPETLPSSVLSFILESLSNITGHIPPNLFSSSQPATTLFFHVAYCDISGTIPAGLFIPFNGSSLASFAFRMPFNSISGVLPAGLFDPFQSAALSNFAVELSNNALIGPIPTLPRGLLGTSSEATLSLVLDHNMLSGSIPTAMLSNWGSIKGLTMNLAYNQLSGNLPNALFNNVTSDGYISKIVIDLRNNFLTGSIASTFLTSLLGAQNISITALQLFLSGNALTGSIPSDLYISTPASAPSAKRDPYELQNIDSALETFSRRSVALSSEPPRFILSSLILDLSNNKLIGSIPNMLDGVLGLGSYAQVLLNDNLLSGTFPDTLANAFRFGGSLAVVAKNNTLVGNAPTNCNGLTISVDVSFNQLDGTIASPTSCFNLYLDISSNFGLRGSIPPTLFSIDTLRLRASNTNLSDSIPQYLTSLSATIDLSSTNIDFCTLPLLDAPDDFYTASRCLLDHTSACGCPGNYTGCSIDCTPSTAPTFLIPPAPTSTTCNPKTRPSLEFTCINGVWTATSTSSPTLTIPSGAGVIVVEGNVSSSTIVINGIGSKIVIGGCSTNLSTIIIELSPEEVKQLETRKSLQDLVTLSNTSQSCNSDLNSVTLKTKTSGCRKVSTEKVVSESGHTLSALFVVNSSGCNTWWIILVSVVVVVIIVGVIAAVIAGVLWNRHVEKKDFDRLETGNKSYSS